MYYRKILYPCALLCITIACNSLYTATFYVGPGRPYSNIQAAFSDAATGDTILLDAGNTFTGSGNYGITIDKDITMSSTGDGSNPIIDLQSLGRLCIISSSITVTISNLTIQNGSASSGGAIQNSGTLTISNCIFDTNIATGPDGGAIYNDGILIAMDCIFSTNNALQFGGAIRNQNQLNMTNCTFNNNSTDQGGAIFSEGTINATGCTFDGNSAGSAGGAVLSYGTENTIECSRFVNNTASDGYDIYGTATATNNWWGTNEDPSTIPHLLFGFIVYTPWITVSLTKLIGTDTSTTIKATFSSDCIPDGVPVAFSSTDGILTPTIASTVNGTASSTLSGHHTLQLTLTATVGPDAENYFLSSVATSVPVNPYRFNFGCLCSDLGTQHVLIGSHNMPTLEGNTLDCWVFDEEPTATCTKVAALNIGAQVIMDSATYNNGTGMNIAILTQTQEGSTALILAEYDGTNITQESSTSLSSQAFKAQWFVASDATPYIVVDTGNGMSLYSVNLTTYELTLTSSTPNLASGIPSTFLRWLHQGDSFYVIQGYQNNYIATYKIDFTTGTISSGVYNDLSSDFININSCATCSDYLVLAGADNDTHGTLIRYTLNGLGQLVFAQSASIADTLTVNYCELCCCNNSYLLAGTDNGLYSVEPDTFDLVASNTSMPNNNWINTCWCCDITGDYCIAVNNNHESYVLQQVGSSLNRVLELPN